MGQDPRGDVAARWGPRPPSRMPSIARGSRIAGMRGGAARQARRIVSGVRIAETALALDREAGRSGVHAGAPPIGAARPSDDRKATGHVGTAHRRCRHGRGEARQRPRAQSLSDPPAHGARLLAPLLPPLAKRFGGRHGRGETAGKASANAPVDWFD